MLSTPIVPDPDYNITYEPSEDSFLFLDLFESLHSEKYFTSLSVKSSNIVLEIGSGSGIISAFIDQHKIIPNSLLLDTDINPHAILQTHKTCPNSDIIQCNLTDPIRPNLIDVLIFNPPYVPSENVPTLPASSDSETWLDLALVGGNDGMQITNLVLNNLNEILSTTGEAYILFCARNNHQQVADDFKSKNHNFTVKQLIHRKCGWEELAIYRFKKLF